MKSLEVNASLHCPSSLLIAYSYMNILLLALLKPGSSYKGGKGIGTLGWRGLLPIYTIREQLQSSNLHGH